MDSSEYGIDGEKKVKGRKEHIIVDTLGLPMAVKIHAANIHDSVGAIEPIKQLRYIVAP
ncbi:transposase [Bacteroides pyogenes]|uniref:transposase n=1 Tax=Bacteroides pyogenes TaxID=310300 RepID=UPI001E521852|nr:MULTISPECIES: transposase [Bacteroidales]